MQRPSSSRQDGDVHGPLAGIRRALSHPLASISSRGDAARRVVTEFASTIRTAAEDVLRQGLRVRASVHHHGGVRHMAAMANMSAMFQPNECQSSRLLTSGRHPQPIAEIADNTEAAPESTEAQQPVLISEVSAHKLL